MRIDHSHSMKLVILGRDGTLNRYRDDHVKSIEELEPLPGALEAVARLNHAGWHTVMATNQAGIGRGLLDMTSLNAIHIRLNQLLVEKPGLPRRFSFTPISTMSINCVIKIMNSPILRALINKPTSVSC